MPQPFALTTWFRHRPLTVLLLVATVCVDVVAMVLTLQGDSLSNFVLFPLAISQLSLLAWWVSAPGKGRLGRLVLLLCAVGGFSYPFVQPVGPPSYGQMLAYFSVHAFAVLACAIGWRLLYLSRMGATPAKPQFSVADLFAAMTICAVLAALGPFADFSILTEFSESIVLLNTVPLGVMCPGLMFYARTETIRWLAPIVLGVLFTAASVLVADAYYAPGVWCLLNGVSVVMYLIWGARVWAPGPNPPAEPEADAPFFVGDHSPPK